MSRTRDAPSVPPRAKSAALWGLVGAFAFLALAQGYALLATPLLGIPGLATVALAVGVAAGASAYVLEPRVRSWAVERTR